jgi:DHA1 family bicyclomycin/chloramphenicol resistance-like MFS transporter
MALNAFAIDAMIPALPDIGRALNVPRENDRQLVVIAYFIGTADPARLGPLADRLAASRSSLPGPSSTAYLHCCAALPGASRC